MLQLNISEYATRHLTLAVGNYLVRKVGALKLVCTITCRAFITHSSPSSSPITINAAAAGAFYYPAARRQSISCSAAASH